MHGFFFFFNIMVTLSFFFFESTTDSAMQYDEFTFAIDDKKPTMTAKNGKRLGNHEGFSQVTDRQLTAYFKIYIYNVRVKKLF